MTIIKTIIPAAGLGTKFLPYTKAIPKEMLPVLNKPTIQYAIEEGLGSGTSQFILITSKGKNAIADHIDATYNHQATLIQNNQQNLLASVDRINRLGTYTYIRQHEPLGLGHAISLAQQSINVKEYFGIIAPEYIFDSKDPVLKQLIRIASQEKVSVIAVQEVSPQCTSSHEMIKIKKQITPNLFQISQIIKNPSFKDSPSNLAIVGRYILSPKIFPALDYISTMGSEEIELYTSINQMIQSNERVFAYKVQGCRYNLSTPLGWLTANIGYALKNPEYAMQIKDFLQANSGINPMLYTSAQSLENIF